ncbi:MAG TPA: DUF4401 domain-containing protein [Rhodocyclaceae bacterium]|nr:DUF4401 domain-containing protein [Rhodocyclaceae bacterium]
MSGFGFPAPAMAQAAEALRAQGVVDDLQHDRLLAAAQVPWWLMLLQTLAAWVASLLILSSFMLPLSLLGDHALVRALAGVALCVVAVVLFRRDRLFTGQMALAFSLAGQALVVSASGTGWGAFFDDGRLWAASGLAVAAAMMWPRSNSLHRSLCALLMAFHAGALIGEGTGLAVYGAGLAAAVAALWLSRPQWADSRNAARLAAFACGGAVAALALPAIVGVAGDDVWRFVLAGGSPFSPQADALSIGTGLVFVAVVERLTTTDARTRRAALAAALVLAILSQPAPGLLVAASLALACFHGGHRSFAALALAAAVAYVGEYYYRLDTSLLVKSALMAISGGVLLALRQALPAAVGMATAVRGAPAERTGAADLVGSARDGGTGLRVGVAVAFVLVVGLTGHVVLDRERVLDEGRVVLFELAPVDPRSLMQGDYMALRFAIDDALPRRAGAAPGPLPRFAYVELDADGRASLAGVGDDLPAASTLVTVRIRLRDGAPSVGPNAFFFQEGRAAVFEGARWGEFRVAADGTALLTHLRDEKLQRLGMP